jgi:hypothetical protein
MSHIGDHECAILNAKVGMGKERQDSHNLVLVPESCDQRAHGPAPPKVMEQLQLVLDPQRTAGNVDLLQCNISRFSPFGDRLLHSPSLCWGT